MHKGKKVLIFIAVTLGVYLSFKFLLPLFLPFLAAYWLSLLLKPQAKGISRLTGLPLSISTAVLLFLWITIIGIGLWYTGRLLLSQVSGFISTFPVIFNNICGCISDICCRIDGFCGIEDGTIYCWLMERYDTVIARAEDGTVDYVVGNGVPIISNIFNIAAILIIVIIGTVLSASSWERIRKWRSTSVFRVEIDRITSKLKNVAVSFAGTQFVILLSTSVICIIGLIILGNKYSVMFGIGIGLIDMLPIFGTGTVFIPWVAFLCISGNYYRAAIVMTIYMVCYFLREFLEARLMGNGIGIGSFETLITIYVGLKLFGLAGAVLGPVGFIIIRELMDLYCKDANDESVCTGIKP